MKISRVIAEFAAALVISGSIACGKTEPERAELIIPRDTFILILADVHIFESTNQLMRDNNMPGFNLFKAYKWTFEKYRITESQFRISVEYYASDPEDFELIYDAVINRIGEMQAEIISKPH